MECFLAFCVIGIILLVARSRESPSSRSAYEEDPPQLIHLERMRKDDSDALAGVDNGNPLYRWDD